MTCALPISIAGIASRRSLMIGDRLDRDGEAARQIGMKALIRSRHSLTEAATFRSYGDPLFQPVLQGVGAEASVAAPHARHALLPEGGARQNVVSGKGGAVSVNPRGGR